MIYLDNAATTRPFQEVVDAMLPYLNDEYGNASAIYSLGKSAKRGIEHSRSQVASLLGCHSDNVIFTSGGSEGNSMVFKGIAEKLIKDGKKHILVSSVEHDSVIKAAKELTKLGFDVQLIPVDACGVVSPCTVEHMMRPDTGLVSVMAVNNETGTLEPVEDIGSICLKHNILFHTDCVQAAGTHKINVEEIGCDFATISSHKIHGVKGVGALFVKNRGLISPLINGGGEQEYGLRGGTENVPGIVAFGKACEVSISNQTKDLIYLSTLKQTAYMKILTHLKDDGLDGIVHVNGSFVATPGKILNLRFDGVDGETLVLLLNNNGICASAGSACRSHEAKPSHVLQSMGLSDVEARSSIRLSFSTLTSMEDVDTAAMVIAMCVKQLLKNE